MLQILNKNINEVKKSISLTAIIRYNIVKDEKYLIIFIYIYKKYKKYGIFNHGLKFINLFIPKDRNSFL